MSRELLLCKPNDQLRSTVSLWKTEVSEEEGDKSTHWPSMWDKNINFYLSIYCIFLYLSILVSFLQVISGTTKGVPDGITKKIFMVYCLIK